ncbi:YtxH domain-containing protein [Cellulomonas sp. DKR-3]|uniref:YtxH domain-containing protein n=1 Tax=Cellulomonas fulva TaxID=2835530 RepID=A0ABS5TW39_9CELL|nr:YtxH domain-containing protein [Cellulomonas fulva]MBT0993355.1 YtxH domain-containing protein [Cellulomonas fulva]
MSGKVTTFVAGVGVGYLLATRRGREMLGKAGEKAGDVWRHPKVQSYVQDVEEQAKQFAKDQGTALKDKAVDAARAAMPGHSEPDEPTVVVEPDTSRPIA